MAEAELAFDYVAVDPGGKRVRGRVAASTEKHAYSTLKRQGLSPIKLSQRRVSTPSGAGSDKAALKDIELEGLLGDLGALLRAGSDIRSALAILGRRSAKGDLRAVCETLSVSIGGGEGAEAAFVGILNGRHAVIPALLAAGEAGGDLAAGLERGAQVLASRRAIDEQLISALSYPAFVLLSTLAAAGVILFGVVPSLAPLVEDAGTRAPLALAILLVVSDYLRGHVTVIGLGLAAVLAGLMGAGRAGILTRPLQKLALDGPARGVLSSLVYGAFAQSLGAMLTARAPMGEALRLAIRTVSWAEARDRLGPVLTSVRQGETLSVALERAPGFPAAIARLAAVGEATGAQGPMLARAGAFEEAAALKRIEAASKLLGPALIVVLGLAIGVMMASILSGVTGLGDAALQ